MHEIFPAGQKDFPLPYVSMAGESDAVWRKKDCWRSMVVNTGSYFHWEHLLLLSSTHHISQPRQCPDDLVDSLCLCSDRCHVLTPCPQLWALNLHPNAGFADTHAKIRF